MREKWLSWPESAALLATSDIPEPIGTLVSAGADLTDRLLGEPPYVVKIVGPTPLHKANEGLLTLGLCTADEAAEVADQLLARAYAARPSVPWSALIQPMVLGGLEFFVGGLSDQEFGPVVSVGLGGSMVEAIDRVAFRACNSLTVEDVGEMVAESGIGRQILDIESMLAPLVMAVAGLMVGEPRLMEIDLNPVILASGGLHLVDVRIKKLVEE